jgi:SET domain-containing protein
MLMVKTHIAPSRIAGIGVFADQDIPAGTLTWRFMPGYDLLLTQSAIDALPESARSSLLDLAYYHAATNCYVLCADNARFMNHADEPNTARVQVDGAIEDDDIATRDSRVGEEMTCDYRLFDADEFW